MKNNYICKNENYNEYNVCEEDCSVCPYYQPKSSDDIDYLFDGEQYLVVAKPL